MWAGGGSIWDPVSVQVEITRGTTQGRHGLAVMSEGALGRGLGRAGTAGPGSEPPSG